MLKKMTAALAMCVAASAFGQAKTFTNPVAENGEDPWVVAKDGMFYYAWVSGPGHLSEYSDNETVWVSGSDSLLECFNAQPHNAWTPVEGTMYSKELWAPELHWVDGAWYIYVAADDGANVSHRTFVLKREDADPRGPFEFKGELMLPGDKWAIDATLFEHNGKLYCSWSGWPGDRNESQCLYVCEMKDPVTPVGERVLISKPEKPWELRGGAPGLPTINEGADVFTNPEGDRTFLIYAASGSWSDFYCLGLMELVGEDPLDPKAWKKQDNVWLESANGVTAPGHASVTTSPDGTEQWLVYHSAKRPGAGWDRQVNIQKITYDANGLPTVKMSAPGESVAAPSGE